MHQSLLITLLSWAVVDPFPMMVVGAEVLQLEPNQKGHSMPFPIAKVNVMVSYNIIRYMAVIEWQMNQ